MTTPKEPTPELIERAKRMADGEDFYVDVPDIGLLGSDEQATTEESATQSAKPTTKRQRPRSINHGEFVRKEDK